MKALNTNFMGLILLLIVILSACNFNQKSTSDNKKECEFVAQDTIIQWNIEFQKPTYDIYRNFNDIPFPKKFITGKIPYPENKHLIFCFGYKEETQQTYYLYALIGNGIIGEQMDLDYSTLMHFSKEKNKWVKAEKTGFEDAINNWKIFVEQSAPLPTLGYTVPNEDINICAHKSYDRIRFGVNISTDDINYQLKLYFHEEELEGNPTGDDFDACIPCPPICGD